MPEVDRNLVACTKPPRTSRQQVRRPRRTRRAGTLDRRILVLPAAAVVILALVAYKFERLSRDRQQPASPVVSLQSAPLFSAYDMENKLVRLDTYLGRHEILLVFFDSRQGFEGDPAMTEVRQHLPELQQRGMKVFGVSTLLPQDNRKTTEQRGPAGFPLLSDPAGQVHQSWGRIDSGSGAPLTGVFYIDRAGRVQSDGRFPLAWTNPRQQLRQLLDED